MEHPSEIPAPSGRPRPRFVRAAGVRAGIAALGLLLAAPLSGAQSAGMFSETARGDLSAEELAAVQALVNDYRFTDLAVLWIDARLKDASTNARPELEWIRDVDVPRANGDIDGADAANQALAKKYPSHRRAKTAQLEAVYASMAKVHALTHSSRYETDSAARAQLIAERERIYRTEVLAELESNIAKLEADAKQDAGNEEKSFQRDRWEHYRLKAMQQYAKLLPEGSAEAKATYEKLVELALWFVDNRYQNFGFQYEAQLIYGQALGALGRSEEAAQALELLIEIEPITAPPFDPQLVQIIRLLRIQALQGSAEAWNRAGAPEKAAELFDRIEGVPQPHFPWHMDPEDPVLLPFVVSMDIEEGIARLCGGVRQEGVSRLRALIARFDSPAFRKGSPEAAETFLLEIAEGLARALDTGVADLSAELYYRAGLGFQGQGRYDDAIRAATLALDAGGGVPGEELWVASALYLIGECYDSVDIPEAAALAYQTLSLDFLGKKGAPRFDVLLPDAAQNWYALALELAEGQKGPWQEISGLAQTVFGELSRGEAGITLQLERALKSEERGQYEEARQVYLAIPRDTEVDGKPKRVEAYYRARASAARCAFRKAVAEGRAAEGLAAIVAEVEPLVAAARAEKDAAGEAALRFEVASAQWTEPVRDRDAALAALAPLLTEVTGKNPYREGCLLLWVSILSWGDVENPANGPRPAEAEPVLAAMKSDFSEGLSMVGAIYSLIEAYQGRGETKDLERAAELAIDYTRHPEAAFDAASPGVKLTLAGILIQGGKHREAQAILEKARQEAGDDPQLKILIVHKFAEAGNAAGSYKEVLEGLNAFIGENEDSITSGDIEEAPYLLYQRAIAEIGIYEKDRDAARLGRAEKDLENAVAILQQRRSSLIRTGKLTPEFERDYWNCFLQYLLVLKAQNRCEVVVGLIQGERIKKGGQAFAPPALQAKFDQLEKDCK